MQHRQPGSLHIPPPSNHSCVVNVSTSNNKLTMRDLLAALAAESHAAMPAAAHGRIPVLQKAPDHS